MHVITNNNQDDWEPAISPDGSQIAFVSARDGRNQIDVMNADGSNQTRLTNDQGSDEYPNLSPVGSKISFSRTINSKTSLFVMNAGGTSLTELAPTMTGSNWAQTWSRDGTQVAFVSDRTGHRNLYAVNIDGSNLRRLASSTDDEAPR